MHATRNNTPITAMLLLALLVMSLTTGCTQPRTVSMESLADPELTLPTRDAALISIAIVRVSDDRERPKPTVVPRDKQTLSERNLRAAVERGVRDAGFPVVSTSEAEYILYCSSETITGERQTYRRMPVHETTVGSIHTRRGWRTFHGTTTSDVVVPVTRSYTHRIITMTVHRQPLDDAPPTPDEQSAIWMGRILGDEADLADLTAPAARELLRSWGRTERRTVRVDALAEEG